MKQHQPTHAKSKPGHPTLIGTLVFTIINFVLLSAVAWIFLETWFFIKIIFSNEQGYDAIRIILEKNLDIIQCNNYIANVFSKFNYLKSELNSLLGNYIGGNSIRVFLDTTEIILLRIVVFIEWLPFMIVILFLFTIDGLVLRDKRKFQGTRESTFVFHRLKPLATLSFYLLFFSYLIFPNGVSPFVFLFPMVMVSSWFTARSIKNFKKYL